MSASPFGFALRNNGSCLGKEKDCGDTVSPFTACCPHGSYCPSQYNVNCCPSNGNCTSALMDQPKCANETWDMYDSDGYFCCLPGHKGYSTDFGSVGCASKGYSLADGETWLKLLAAGIDSSSTTTSAESKTSTSAESKTSSQAQTSTASSDSSTNDPSSSGGSSTNVGAIAGGVVGGVVAIALIGLAVWFIMRKKKAKQSTGGAAEIDGMQKHQQQQHPQQQYPQQQQQHPQQQQQYFSELPGNHGASELQG